MLFEHYILTEILTTTSLSASKSNNTCSKCGTLKKSGKFTCCARGGAWFKKCGDAGDTKFDHTWSEGIQACRDFVDSQQRSHHLLVISQSQSFVQRPDSTQPTHAYHPSSISTINTVADSKDRVGLTNIVLSTCCAPIASYLLM